MQRSDKEDEITPQDELAELGDTLSDLAIHQKDLVKECFGIKSTIWEQTRNLPKGLHPVDVDLLDVRARMLKARNEQAKAAIKYSKIECFDFSRRIKSILPAELRELVYQYLYPGQLFCTVKDDMRRWDCGDKLDYFVQTKTDFIWDPEFVGLDIVVEITKHCYRNAIFHFYDPSYIPQFLTRPIPRLSITAKDIITLVSVSLNDNCWNGHGNSRLLRTETLDEIIEQNGLPEESDMEDGSGVVLTEYLKSNMERRRKLCDGILSLQQVSSRLFDLSVFIDVGYVMAHVRTDNAEMQAVAATFWALNCASRVKKDKEEWNIKVCFGAKDDDIGEEIKVEWPMNMSRDDIRAMVRSWRDHPVFWAKNRMFR